MIISAITIENFKSIKEPVRIELKPITLLFGPNSVGKSTIIQALNYARELMESSWVDVDQTKSGGDTIRLGGFSNIVHNHDLGNAIRLRFELDFNKYKRESADEIEEEIEEICDKIYSTYQEDAKLLIRYYREQIQQNVAVWFEIVIEQDNKETKPFISSATAGVGGEPLLILGSDNYEDSLSPSIKYIDIENKIFPIINGKSLASYFIAITPSQDDDSAPDGDGEKVTCNPLFRLPNCIFKLWAGGHPYSLQVANGFKENYSRFEAILDAIWDIHYRAAKQDLEGLCYLGPLREVPSVEFDPNDTISHRWDKGLAAWSNISLGSDYYINVINQAFKEDLKTQYEIVLKRYKELDLDSPLYKILTEIKSKENTGDIKEMLENLPVKSRVFLRENNGGIEMLPKDVGVGISQVLPIIPLALSGGWDNEKIIAIEQPELHIHPAMQVGLADVFIEGLQYENNMLFQKRFLLETHSEHILLRLLRRIREPREETNEELQADDLGVYYLEQSSSGVKATRLRINNDGEFLDEWPAGFFEEREEELL